MAWVSVGMAAMGVLKGEGERKRAENKDESRARMAAYAPWSSFAERYASQESAPVADGVAQGLQGAAMGSQISANLKSAPAEAAAKTAESTPDYSIPKIDPEQEKWLRMKEEEDRMKMAAGQQYKSVRE